MEESTFTLQPSMVAATALLKSAAAPRAERSSSAYTVAGQLALFFAVSVRVDSHPGNKSQQYKLTRAASTSISACLIRLIAEFCISLGVLAEPAGRASRLGRRR